MARFEVWDGTQYVALPGIPGPQMFAQVGGVPPVPRAVGDVWANTTEPLVKEWDDDWKYPTLLNGWVDYDAANYGPARYRKAPGGLVVVIAMIRSGTVGNLNVPAFVLPEGYRPRHARIFAGQSSGDVACRININYSIAGSVQVQNGSNAWVSIHTVFAAEGG